MASFTNFNPQDGGSYQRSGGSYPSQPGYSPSVSLPGGGVPYVPPTSGRRGGSKDKNDAWGISFIAVCGFQLLLCLILHLFLRQMPGGYATGLNTFGTIFNVLLLAVSVLGIVAGIQRTRPLLNSHFMVALLAMVMGLNMTTSTSKDVHLGCNIIMMEMNLHVAEKAVMKMSNQALMDSVSARLRELDTHVTEMEDVTHSKHLAKEEERTKVRDDYFILYSKMTSLRRHAKTVMDQVMHMTAMIKHEAEKEDLKLDAKARLEKKVQRKLDDGEEVPEDLKDLDQAAEATVQKERESLLADMEMEDPHDLAEDLEDVAITLSPEMQKHVDKLKELLDAADSALDKAQHPIMVDKDGELESKIDISAREYKDILNKLTYAAEEIVKMEDDLSKEIGATKVKDIGKGAHLNTKKKWGDFDDDDYLRFDDYDYMDEETSSRRRTQEMNPNIPGAHEMLKELHQESDEIAERLDRFKTKDYKSEIKHHSKVEEARGMRKRRRSQHQAVFERELDKSLEAHEHLMDQWDRGSSTCNKANEVVPQLMAVSIFITFMQMTSTYLSLSLIFRLPTKRAQ